MQMIQMMLIQGMNMQKQHIDSMEFKGTVKIIQYHITPEFIVYGVDGYIEPKDYFTRKEHGVLYPSFEAPMSAKGFYVLDTEVEDGDDGILTASYVVNANIPEVSFNSYRKNIIDPIVAQFWKDTKESVEATENSYQKAMKELIDKSDIKFK